MIIKKNKKAFTQPILASVKEKKIQTITIKQYTIAGCISSGPRSITRKLTRQFRFIIYKNR